MKKEKKPVATVMLYFRNGAKVQVITTHTKDEATKLISTKEKWAELDAINDNPEVEDENFCFQVDDVFMFTVTTTNDSKIITSPEAGKIKVM